MSGDRAAAGLRGVEAALAMLRARLPPAAFRPLAARYLEDPRGRLRGAAAAVIAPASTAEAAEVVRAAVASGTAIVPYGGGTGLVGGQVPQAAPVAEGRCGAKPILVSMERMAAIRAVHPQDAVIVAEAGAILADIQAAAAAEGMLFPLSLAAQGSCRIGGNLATNAGGLNVLRYGTARDLCLGLEAVLPDGSVWNGLSRLRKDNTGYDLKNLLIGSEGTLGLITAASLRLFPRPSGEATAILAVRGPAAALAVLTLARAEVGEAVSAAELMHRQGLDFVARTLPHLRQPFAVPPEWSLLVDLGLPGRGDPHAALEAIFGAAVEAGLAVDGVVARSEAQRGAFWALREAIPEANRRIGAIASHDISLPLGAVAGFVEAAPAVLSRIAPVQINCFGHVGDGNLHYNLFPAEGAAGAVDGPTRAALTRAVHDLTHAHGGSVSAEHGIGRAKVADLARYGDPARLASMRAIKAALDPAGIMNPGVILP